MIRWLKENQEPEEKNKDFMAKTAHHRKQLIYEELLSVGEIVQEFPQIFDAGMVRLLYLFYLGEIFPCTLIKHKFTITCTFD